MDHTAIARLLQQFGITVDDDLPLCIDWLESSILGLRPENSLLSVPDAVFLRLPATLHEVRTAVRRARTADQSGTISQLMRPVGQMMCALSLLIVDIKDLRISTATARHLEICRFSSLHWPNWFDAALGELQPDCAMAKVESVCATADLIAEHVDAVAVSELLRQFFRGSQHDAVDGTLGACLAAVRYPLSSNRCLTSDDIDLLRGILGNDPQWRNIAQPFEGTAKELAASGARGQIAADAVRWLDNVRLAMPRITSFFEAIVKGEDVSQEAFQSAHSDLDLIVTKIMDFASLSSRLHESIRERSPHA